LVSSTNPPFPNFFGSCGADEAPGHHLTDVLINLKTHKITCNNFHKLMSYLAICSHKSWIVFLYFQRLIFCNIYKCACYLICAFYVWDKLWL
jgi:hypothetical protein